MSGGPKAACSIYLSEYCRPEAEWMGTCAAGDDAGCARESCKFSEAFHVLAQIKGQANRLLEAMQPSVLLSCGRWREHVNPG